ncbi:MAG TPA: GGDEF domain-containing protein [Rubrivivax sp.]|nr:GGDEF domain-containing protein [Rubrivivax sp.]
MRRPWTRVVLLAAAALAGAAGAQTAAFEQRIDALLRQGCDRPDAALAELQALQPAAQDPAAARLVLLARGIVLAQNGRDAEAQRAAAALQAQAEARRDRQAAAGAHLVQALTAHNAGRLDVAASAAAQARDALQPDCPVLAREAGQGQRGSAAAAREGSDEGLQAAAMSCEHRIGWQVLQLLQQYAVHTGDWSGASRQARLARELAAAAGDDARVAWSSGDLAWLSARSDGIDAALPLLHQAQRLAQRSGDPLLQARTLLAEAQMAGQRGDHDSVLRLAGQALPLARAAGSPRLEASVLSFVSDAQAKLGRPAEALRAAERGLPIVRRHRDRRIELALVNNAGLAKIGLKRSAEGLQDLARVEQLTQHAGLGALRAEVLREYDEALAAAGDARGALALFHRERALSAEVARLGREATLAQLRQANDHERQQREIELAARDNQLKAAALASQALAHRVWALAALLVGLAALLLLLLHRRVRATQRQLQSSQARLRVQSERDPLTHLANRRHFLSVMQSASALGPGGSGFDGALLLVDIDHFKHVNDGHGHAAGDLVLCEVARRLSEAVRGGDLVVRWGGEEFLVLALRAPQEQVEMLAERVLRCIGERPVRVQGQPVRVTVSVGYARFPLPPHVLPVAWEQAINLADMALYTAKNQGRNRAVGIVAAQAGAAPELQRIEADFDRAWHEGRVTLKVAPGPLALAA